ncbi:MULTISPECIES: glutamate ABC transporter substrate-binding protein [unclassified Actinotalea]|uniref:glutamate ABC transporter substrate-binding protein n=1 Tax=unclassified Actinotalea TaxID=2638618 RepID=UPI0015F71165|nr:MULTISPECIES: glutamate ABC transporter substrate-binding protein [unclassified Actinotalea]
MSATTRGTRGVTIRRAVAALAVAAATVLTGCTSGAYPETAVPTPEPTAPADPPAAAEPAQCADPLMSYAPQGPPPPPGQVPDGSTMAEIRDSGRLVVGVSADSLLLGARDPISGQIQGFDIDMARLVAEAVTGSADRLELRVITAAQRLPLLQDGTVHLVARNLSITCDRWEEIAFSAEYYRSGQKLLVPLESTAMSLDDLAGQRVCAPAGSTSLAKLEEFEQVEAVPAATHTDCLVRFQQGEVDAITGDDTVLAGLVAQDPYAKVVGEAFTAEHYGLGMNADDVDLVRFVNAVLDQAKADGTWTASYDRWLADALGAAPAPPASVYGR